MNKLTRVAVQRTAWIVGENSAAAKALRVADGMREPAFFRYGSHIVVIDMAVAEEVFGKEASVSNEAAE